MSLASASPSRKIGTMSSPSSSPVPQTFSHYPAWPNPARVRLFVFPAHACTYLPAREATLRGFVAQRVVPQAYHELMDAGFRRSGSLVYQPVCRACRECVPVRVPVERFRPSKSQRRCARRNADLHVTVDQPVATHEKFELYRRYMTEWHGSAATEAQTATRESRGEFETFLYDSPVDTIEFCYRDRAGALLAVGICDVCPRSLSSVYFYFDPGQARRGLGTFGALVEIERARSLGVAHYYLGYRVPGCAAMSYKSSFRPNESLDTDGVWRESAP